VKKYICFVIFTFLFHCLQADFLSDKDYINLARSLHEHDKTQEAVICYKKALEVNPQSVTANLELALACFRAEHYEQALQYFTFVLQLLPNNFYILRNIGILLHKLGKFEESITYFKKALQLKPDEKGVHNKLGISYLSLGDVVNGYKHFDIHLEQEEKESPRLWNGCNVFGKTIYLWDTVGAGDVFCYIRHAKSLKEQGATVILGLRESMIPLISSCRYIDKILPRWEKTTFDYYLHIHKLPRMAYKAGFTIATEMPYLCANESLMKKWSAAFAHDEKFKVGICWCANVYKDQEGKDVKNQRSIPLHYFYSLSKIKQVSLYSLQQVHGTDQLAYMPKDFAIHVFDEDFDKTHGSFSDTAAVMKNLDLVITADTSIAHLAGALGVPVWVILPYVHDSRWTIGQGENQLYENLHLFKQKKLNDWDGVMQEVARALSNLF